MLEGKANTNHPLSGNLIVITEFTDKLSANSEIQFKHKLLLSYPFSSKPKHSPAEASLVVLELCISLFHAVFSTTANGTNPS